MTRTLIPSRAALPGLQAESETGGLPAADGFGWAKQLANALSGRRISQKQLLVITNQLSVMLSSGCDLCAGLESMARQQKPGYLRDVLQDLHDSVKQGHSFSQALARHRDVFNSLYVTMVRAGESAGLLKGMLQGLHTLIRNQLRVAGQVKSALMYPAILIVVALTAITVMTTFVLPRFALIFKQSRAPLPASTAFVLNAAEWIGGHWLPLIIGVLVGSVGLLWILAHPLVRPVVHAWVLKIPLVGPTIRLSACCRSIQTMGLLLRSGLPLAECIILTRDMMSNVYYWEFFEDLHQHISEGKGIAQHFESTDLFPPMVAQMIHVGEQTGTLANVCLEISAYYEEELSARIKVLTTALEPLIIVLMGGFVGFIAVSVILPMFRISSAIH